VFRSHDLSDRAYCVLEQFEPMAIFTQCKYCRIPLKAYFEDNGKHYILEEEF